MVRMRRDDGGRRPAPPATRRLRPFAPAATLFIALLVAGPAALAQESLAWLARAADAARTLNYVGTVVYQYGSRVETSRLVHLNERGSEAEKLVNLDGPAREVIRAQGEVRCYYPDAKVLRIEPRTFRNAFPSLSPQQQKALADYYVVSRKELERVAGMEAQAWEFEPKDRFRYRQKFWVDANSGLLLKVRISNERNETVEQFAFTDLVIGGNIDREMVRPTWIGTPPNWQVQHLEPGRIEVKDTGWEVSKLPPGFAKTGEGFRTLSGKREPVAHLVYSDGLVAVSVFIEGAGSAPRASGHAQIGGVNVYVRQLDDYVVTVLGEAPGVTVRQIANSVTHRQGP
jgi:sigma-E factor negative regulatory protein RseB